MDAVRTAVDVTFSDPFLFLGLDDKYGMLFNCYGICSDVIGSSGDRAAWKGAVGTCLSISFEGLWEIRKVICQCRRLSGPRLVIVTSNVKKKCSITTSV